jgi:hypothetical protein
VFKLLDNLETHDDSTISLGRTYSVEIYSVCIERIDHPEMYVFFLDSDSNNLGSFNNRILSRDSFATCSFVIVATIMSI